MKIIQKIEINTEGKFVKVYQGSVSMSSQYLNPALVSDIYPYPPSVPGYKKITAIFCLNFSFSFRSKFH